MHQRRYPSLLLPPHLLDLRPPLLSLLVLCCLPLFLCCLLLYYAIVLHGFKSLLSRLCWSFCLEELPQMTLAAGWVWWVSGHHAKSYGYDQPWILHLCHIARTSIFPHVFPLTHACTFKQHTVCTMPFETIREIRSLH